MSTTHAARIHRTQQQLDDSTALLVSDPLDIFYLTGFICLTPEEREGYVLLTQHSEHLFLSSFSTPTEVDQLQVHLGGVERLVKEKLPLILKDEQLTSLSIDGNTLRLNEYEFLRMVLGSEVLLTAQKESIVSKQRIIKDILEIESISKANAITHTTLDIILSKLKVGMTELDVQFELEQSMRNLGVSEFAFPTIVCFGDHTALPHHQPGNRQLQNNMPVLIDCGAKWQKYCADITRTIWFGENPDPEFQQIENIVRDAYLHTMAKLEAHSSVSPVTTSELDKVARDHITHAGFGSQFIHTTGHGVGLYIHEQPSLNVNNMTPVQANMIITIEPGIYLPGKFGYRFENSVLVAKDGAKELL